MPFSSPKAGARRSALRLEACAQGLSKVFKEFEQADEGHDADEDEDEDVDAPQYETATGVTFEAAHP
jgi:hypothetical protein